MAPYPRAARYSLAPAQAATLDRHLLLATPPDRLKRRLSAMKLARGWLHTAFGGARHPVHEPEPEDDKSHHRDHDRRDEAQADARTGILAAAARVRGQNEHMEAHAQALPDPGSGHPFEAGAVAVGLHQRGTHAQTIAMIPPAYFGPSGSQPGAGS